MNNNKTTRERERELKRELKVEKMENKSNKYTAKEFHKRSNIQFDGWSLEGKEKEYVV